MFAIATLLRLGLPGKEQLFHGAQLTAVVFRLHPRFERELGNLLEKFVYRDAYFEACKMLAYASVRANTCDYSVGLATTMTRWVLLV